MAFFVRPLTLYEVGVLEKLLIQTDPTSLVYKRSLALALSHRRLKTGEIARQLDVMQFTVSSWIKRFNSEGLEWLTSSSAEADTGNYHAANGEALFVRPLSPLEKEKLEQLCHQYQANTAAHKRFVALQLSSQGKTAYEIAGEVGLSYSTVRLWIKRFNSQGLSCLETAGDRQWLARQLEASGF